MCWQCLRLSSHSLLALHTVKGNLSSMRVSIDKVKNGYHKLCSKPRTDRICCKVPRTEWELSRLPRSLHMSALLTIDISSLCEEMGAHRQIQTLSHTSLWCKLELKTYRSKVFFNIMWVWKTSVFPSEKILSYCRSLSLCNILETKWWLTKASRIGG